ncbi:hypothetical protein CHLRE_02g142486v5 [Chlamydomonas reinhardtii]|uniref:Uncharacterized protein n=1 Tax=Chlamydomonas reinhardtii TaxID=3055 RepID=A0A2K3E4E9_CHLRE|nr:uncharacterized protein CHLRE_02g142486v5 [Chlamydomonas reinhardtii]PNW87664.1 hypothetical protein CHLRE_02g142486v5 [Chlamydomonas reinhardtii]
MAGRALSHTPVGPPAAHHVPMQRRLMPNSPGQHQPFIPVSAHYFTADSQPSRQHGRS